MACYCHLHLICHQPCKRGLTTRSSGAPTAGHQARAGGTRYSFASPGLASCRRRPLSSNVRPRRKDRVACQQDQRLSARAEQPRKGHAERICASFSRPAETTRGEFEAWTHGNQNEKPLWQNVAVISECATHFYELGTAHQENRGASFQSFPAKGATAAHRCIHLRPRQSHENQFFGLPCAAAGVIAALWLVGLNFQGPSAQKNYRGYRPSQEQIPYASSCSGVA